MVRQHALISQKRRKSEGNYGKEHIKQNINAGYGKINTKKLGLERMRNRKPYIINRKIPVENKGLSQERGGCDGGTHSAKATITRC